MNGRVYDPKLGRMLSPDPVTQAPENGQNYNRYSYAYNNPLKYTDPSGFDARKIVCEGDSCVSAPNWNSGAGNGPGPMEHVKVTGPRLDTNIDILGNPAALSNWNAVGQEALTNRVNNSYVDQKIVTALEQGVQNGKITGVAQNGDLVDSQGNVVTFGTTVGSTGAISLNLNYGWGVGGTFGANLAWDSSGNITVQVVTGGGGDTPGASITANVEYTNAESVLSLQGIGAQTGVDVGSGIVVEGGVYDR